MTGRQFARQRARILARGRPERTTRRALAHLAREAGAVPVMLGHKLVGHILPDGFMVCQLRRYPTEAAALGELEGVRAFSHLQPGPVPVRAFPCSHCKGWHLTSRG